MALTPLDIENYRIRSAFRGYSREDVDRLLSLVVRGIEDYVHQIGQLNARLGQLESQVARYRESEDLLTKSVMLAEKTRDELISAAQQRAESIREEAHSEAERIRASIGDIAGQREQFEYAFHGLLTGFLHRLEAGNPRLGGLRETPRLAPAVQEISARELPREADPLNPAEQAQQAAATLFSAPPTPAASPQPQTPSASAAAAAGVPSPDRDGDIAGFEAALSEARPQQQPQRSATTPLLADAPAPGADEPERAFAPGFGEADLTHVANRMDEEEPDFVIHTEHGDVFPEYSEPGQDWALGNQHGKARSDEEDEDRDKQR